MFDTANLAQLGELLELLGRSLIALDAIIDLWRIIHDARQGKDWQFEVVEDVIDIALSWGSGVLIAIILIPLVGYSSPVLLIILGVILGGSAALIIDDFGNSIMEHHLKPLIDNAEKYYDKQIAHLKSLL